MTDENTCPDCAVGVGQPHADGCDVARCKWSGQQLLMCEVLELAGAKPNHLGPCKNTTWKGVWPGEAFALSQGWTIGEIKGSPFPDLNRVYIEKSQGNVVWVPELEDFKLKEDAARG